MKRRYGNGYYFCNYHKKWTVQLRVSKKKVYGGRFATEEDAKAAYQQLKASISTNSIQLR